MILLILFIGCQDKDSTPETNKNETKSVEKEDATKKDKAVNDENVSLFNDLGLSFDEDKIIIDINKTSHFFETFEKRIDKKVEQADINITRDAGVVISEEEIKIDLNQTKNMLDNLSHLFESMISDLNRSVH